MWKTKTFTVRDSKPLQLWTLPGVSKAVLLVLSVAQRALTAYGVRPRQRDVLFQQHGQDLIVVPVGCHDDRCHVHGGGVLWVLNTLHQFLQRVHRNMNFHHTLDVISLFDLKSGEGRRLTAIEGLDDLLGLWLRRMSTAPTTSESIATNKASVACRRTDMSGR